MYKLNGSSCLVPRQQSITLITLWTTGMERATRALATQEWHDRGGANMQAGALTRPMLIYMLPIKYPCGNSPTQHACTFPLIWAALLPRRRL